MEGTDGDRTVERELGAEHESRCFVPSTDVNSVDVGRGRGQLVVRRA
jgi:hypothetical protein